MPIPAIHRRHFLQSASTCVGGTLLAGSAVGAVSAFGATRRADRAMDDVSLKGRLYKTLKIGMVGVEGTLIDKFNACKEAGFDGIEMDSPGMDVKATLTAIQETGLPVDGTVCSSHWSIRHTDSNPETR